MKIQDQKKKRKLNPAISKTQLNKRHAELKNSKIRTKQLKKWN